MTTPIQPQRAYEDITGDDYSTVLSCILQYGRHDWAAHAAEQTLRTLESVNSIGSTIRRTLNMSPARVAEISSGHVQAVFGQPSEEEVKFVVAGHSLGINAGLLARCIGREDGEVEAMYKLADDAKAELNKDSVKITKSMAQRQYAETASRVYAAVASNQAGEPGQQPGVSYSAEYEDIDDESVIIGSQAAVHDAASVLTPSPTQQASNGWTREQDSMLMSLYFSGHPWSTIASATARDQGACTARLATLFRNSSVSRVDLAKGYTVTITRIGDRAH